MQRVKLFAAPCVVVVRRQASYGNLLGRPLFFLQTFPFPLLINHRIPEGAAVRGSDFPSIVGFVVAVPVASRASCKSGVPRLEFRAVVFCMTVDTAYARVVVWLYYCGRERLGLVT